MRSRSIPGSGIGTNAKNLRGRSRDIRGGMSDTGRPRTGVYFEITLQRKIQAARRLDDKPSIILIRPPSIIVTTLTYFICQSLKTFLDEQQK